MYILSMQGVSILTTCTTLRGTPGEHELLQKNDAQCAAHGMRMAYMQSSLTNYLELALMCTNGIVT